MSKKSTSIGSEMARSHMRSARRELLCADLFAGAGGLSAGFHSAGFRSVFFNEIDAAASETFKLNAPHTIPFVCPIEELTAARVRDETSLADDTLDVMVGGPPCQGFSINAPERSTEDQRNKLFRHYLRLVLEGLRPKFVVLENVPGLVSFNGGQTFRDLSTAFEQAGNMVAFRILNAAHYGVPEERWRLVLIGTRLPGVVPTFPMPTHYSFQRPNFTGGRTMTFEQAIGARGRDPLFSANLLAPITVREAIGDLPPIESGEGADSMPYSLPPKGAYQRLMRDGSTEIFNHRCAGLSKVNVTRMQHVKPGGSWRDIPHALLPAGMQRARRSDHTKRYGRFDPDGVSGTIMTKCDPHWGTVIHYEQDRIISVREAARIQSFPDRFQFTGSIADQYRQVGNAVPPLLAKAIANHILWMIERYETGDAKTAIQAIAKEMYAGAR